jgi:excisionase family DNA binding protein
MGGLAMGKLKIEPLILTAIAAGRRLGIGKAKVLAPVHSGRLPAVKLDRRIRVRVADLEAFLASLPPVTP